MLINFLKLCLLCSGIFMLMLTIPHKYEDVHELHIKIIVALVSLLFIGIGLI